MAQRILGLDLGASAVKAVLVESAFRGFEIVDAVRGLIEARGWRFDSAVVAFPGTGGSTSVVTLPFTDPRRIEQTIGFEVEGQIPFDLADVSWDWQPLGVRDGKTELLVAVVRDRKSTRLNSSHVAISYAVFCLKKKK